MAMKAPPKKINIASKTTQESAPAAPPSQFSGPISGPGSPGLPKGDSTLKMPSLNLAAQAKDVLGNEGDKKTETEHSEIPGSPGSGSPGTPRPPCSVKMLYMAPKHSRIRSDVMGYAETEFSSENLKFLLGLRDIDQMLEEDLKQEEESRLTDIAEQDYNIYLERRKALIIQTPEYQKEFKTLYELYILKTSKTSLNLFSGNRNALTSIYDSGKPFTRADFQPAREEIEKLVDSDTLKRYEALGHYKKTLADSKREKEILATFQRTLQQYLEINKKHKTSKGYCYCWGPDRTAIYASLEQLYTKLLKIVPNEVQMETVIDLITMHQKTHLEALGKYEHAFSAVFSTALSDLKSISPSLKPR